MFDAEGSVSGYLNKGKNFKVSVHFSTYESLLNHFQDYLIKMGIKENRVKLYKRHEERDGNCRVLTLTGKKQASKIYSLLYTDATIFLERKHKKFIESIEGEIKCTN